MQKQVCLMFVSNTHVLVWFASCLESCTDTICHWMHSCFPLLQLWPLFHPPLYHPQIERAPDWLLVFTTTFTKCSAPIILQQIFSSGQPSAMIFTARPKLSKELGMLPQIWSQTWMCSAFRQEWQPWCQDWPNSVLHGGITWTARRGQTSAFQPCCFGIAVLAIPRKDGKTEDAAVTKCWLWTGWIHKHNIGFTSGKSCGWLTACSDWYKINHSSLAFYS